MQPELSLLAKMKQGDEAAFTALYRKHKDAVYRFALMCTGSTASAAEVTQETFLHLMTRADQFDPGRGTIAAWLCGVARNLARKEQNGRELPTDPEALSDDAMLDEARIDRDSPLEKILKGEVAEQVRHAVSMIAPHYRDVLILCELSDLSYAEAAQVCNIDIGTVRSRLSRARAQLAERLARKGILAGPARAKEAS